MPYYEHVFIARRDISGQQVENLAESLAGFVTEGGGKVTKTEYWGLRNLAYRIKKNRKGHYVLMNIDSPHDAVAEMERNMRLNEDIIRFMTLRVDELQEGPSAVMQQKVNRDERARRDSRDDSNARPSASGNGADKAKAEPKGDEKVAAESKDNDSEKAEPKGDDKVAAESKKDDAETAESTAKATDDAKVEDETAEGGKS